MAHLLETPPEVLHQIFQEINVTDLANLSKTCRMLMEFLKNDVLLWKQRYLQYFDKPLSKSGPDDIFWQSRLCDLTRIQKILDSNDVEVKKTHLSEVLSTTKELLNDCPEGLNSSLNNSFCVRHLTNQPNSSIFLCRSSLFKNAGYKSIGPAETEAERQLSAQLHVLSGIPLEPEPEDVKNKIANPIHPYARSRIYDLRRYKEFNFWGPFLDDGSQGIDWEKLETIMVVLAHNLKVLHERTEGQFSCLWDKPFHGLGEFRPNSSGTSSSFKSQPQISLDSQDPYGVTGTWMRIVCFLDYNHLYAFNFDDEDLPLEQDRQPLNSEEAIRLIFMKLKVSKIVPPGEDDAQDMPVVHFTGTSRSMHVSWDPNANSKIRGTVRTTPSGAVRWTSFSIYYGEERWRSEGIQVGGRRSARGVLGTWFDKDYDEHGPAGPSAFWKYNDDPGEERHATPHLFTTFFA